MNLRKWLQYAWSLGLLVLKIAVIVLLMNSDRAPFVYQNF